MNGLLANVGSPAWRADHPALFDRGERGKVALFSADEGEAEPVTYSPIFRAADFVNRAVPIVRLPARIEEGVQAIRRRVRAVSA